MPAPTRTSRPTGLGRGLGRPGAALLLVLGVVGVTGCGDASTSTAAPTTAAPVATSAAPSLEPTPTSDGPTVPSVDAAPPSVEPSAPAVEPAGPTVTMAGFAYDVPATVAPGATVLVDNADAEAHTLTATGDGGFAVTVPVDGQGSFVAPTAPGDYPFVCLLHGGMEGVLTVG